MSLRKGILENPKDAAGDKKFDDVLGPIIVSISIQYSFYKVTRYKACRSHFTSNTRLSASDCCSKNCLQGDKELIFHHHWYSCIARMY